jgi:Rod binding domain-containing protein
MDGLASLQLPLNLGAPDPAGLALHVKPGDTRAIEAAATGFESTFMSLLLKEMRQTLDHGTFFGQDNSDVYGGIFDFYMSQHLAKAGGIGIANMLRRQLSTHPGTHDAKPI